MPERVDLGEGVTLWRGDALEVYKQYADNAFGLLWLDPPYYKVKMECAWDRQWATSGAFLEWLGQHADEWQRILAPNGSLYVCASPQMAWEVEGVLRKRFNVASRIVWEKQNGWHQKQNKEEMRQYNDSMTEIIFFCEHYGADNIAKGEAGYAAKRDELRAYLAGEFERAGMLNQAGKIAANVACGFSASAGGMASRHYFSQSQWQLPTPEHYQALRDLLNATGGQYLRREYEDLRRPFFAVPERPFTSVWHYETVQAHAGKHPAEKPYPMVRDVVLTSSREDMLCGDFFCGSGVFGQACNALGRRVVLCDQDVEWVHKAQQRTMGPPLLQLIEQAEPPTQKSEQLPLNMQ